MTVEEIQTQIDNILAALVANPASEVIEYSVGDKTVKKRRAELREELAFWRSELLKASQPKRTILTRF